MILSSKDILDRTHIDFSGVRVAVIGDAMLDCYEIGDVGRISPEAPVPIVRHKERRLVAGGAANVAMNCASLGARVSLFYVAGADSAARELAEILAKAGIDAFPIRDQSRPTSVKSRVVANNQQLLRLDKESSEPIAQPIEDALLGALQIEVNDFDAILISDYAKGCLTDNVLKSVIHRAREAGVPCLVDPKRRDFAAYAGATLIKPNLSEFEAVVGRPLADTGAIELAAAAICESLGSSLLITRSSKGMSLFERGSEPIHLAAQALEVFDVSGAGDTVIATLGAALAKGWELAKAMALSNIAASIVVQKVGTAVLAIEELNSEIASKASASSNIGVTNWEEARNLCRHWQNKGLSVGFTNGCFDLLHPGHVRLIRTAAAHCDRLIVAINSDASVGRLKGPSRPIQCESDRAEVMAALSGVALVTIFDQDTPLELVEYLQPDTIIKGADYREDKVVGSELIKARGGRVVLVPILEERSTSRLVARRMEWRQE